MKLSTKAKKIFAQIDKENTKLGDLRKIAKEIKKDHALALELWSTEEFLPRQLAILIMDKKQLDQTVIDQLDKDIQQHAYEDRIHLTDWLMANQLSKEKKIVSLIESWENSLSPLQRRIFLDSIEKNLMKEKPEVQWAMNYTAGQIGKWQEQYRKRCIAIGEKTGLYKDELVAKNCTPSYLPKFISIEVEKLKLNK